MHLCYALFMRLADTWMQWLVVAVAPRTLRQAAVSVAALWVVALVPTFLTQAEIGWPETVAKRFIAVVGLPQYDWLVIFHLVPLLANRQWWVPPLIQLVFTVSILATGKLSRHPIRRIFVPLNLFAWFLTISLTTFQLFVLYVVTGR